MLEQTLESIGLSPKESKMYLTLLSAGLQPTSILARKAGFNRGTAYVILHSLLAKGLATRTTKRKQQSFAPMDPQHLLRFLYLREKEVQSQKLRAQAIMGSLLAIRKPLTVQPKIEFHEGPEGARTVLESTLHSEEKTLRAFLSIADVTEFVGGDVFEEYTKKRIANGYTLLAIRTHEKDKKAFSADPRSKRYVTNTAERREIRHASEELAFPMTMYMFDNKLAIISSEQENFAVLIESKEFADMQKKLFDLLWKSLK